VALPAIQAILRSQMALAAKGNGPAQRAVIAAVLAIEEEEAHLEAERRAREAKLNEPTDLIDAARRVCWLLKIARDEEDLITGRTRPQGDAGAAPAEGVASGAGGATVPPTATLAGTPSTGASSTELPLAGAPEEATTPAVASSGRSCPRDKPPTAVPSPGASSNSASSASAPSSSASPAGTSTAGASFAPRSSASTVPPDVPRADAPWARASAARSTLADAAAADAAWADALPPQNLPARTPRGAWRERVSPEAMLWSGKSLARPCHPIRNGSRPDWHSGQFGPR